MEEAERKQEIERLLQLRRVKFIEKPNAEAFVCAYSCEDAKNGFHTYCYLLPPQLVEDFLNDLGWSHRSDDFKPHVECVVHRRSGKKVRDVFYLRDGNESGAHALVHVRHFWGLRPSSPEIAEEFRLFHNLYHDAARNIFLHCAVHGVEHEVVRVSGHRVEVQLRFLTDFLRAKQMHLAMQWDGAYWCNYSLAELGLKSIQKEQRGANFRWELCARDDLPTDDCKCISRLIGKALIRCPGPLEYHDPFKEDPAAFPAFTVGQDEHGAPVTNSCDPETLRRDAGRGLQPVFFRRRVLRKYFDDPAKFSVEDGYLRCGSLWGLKMDNDHPKYVIVFLKDLELLPPAERQHWLSQNVLPDGCMSETCYTRNIRGWFADPKMPDLRLKNLYPRVNGVWKTTHGWPLWREPAQEDRYVFHQAHVCLEDDQAEFDQQNGLLAKMLNDFINAEEIQTNLRTPPVNPQDPKKAPPPLSLLQQFLIEAGHADAKERLRPLRLVQELRSTGAAHSKGGNYKDALKKAGLDRLPLVEASMKVFAGTADFIEWLNTDVLKNKS